MAKDKKSNSAANLGFEAKLWATADTLHGNMDAAEYKQLEPYRDRMRDPCGSPGMFVQSVEFIRTHASGNDKRGSGDKAQTGAKPDISIYGQKSNYTTWRLAKRALAICGIDGQIVHGETFHNDHHPGLKADFTNPPFNDDRRLTTLREDPLQRHGH